MSNQFFPFGPAPGNPYLAYLPYDLQISEIDPGLILNGTEPNAVYVAFREVAGCSWWVLNADFIPDANQWQQNYPQNAATPAWALEQCENGTVTRYVAAATNVPGTPVVWVPVWSLDQYGDVTIEPQTGTSTAQIPLNLNITWNAGSPAVMSAIEINLTDTSSNPGSYLENYSVNGTPVWQVRKDGTLVTGIIPFSHIIIPNPWIITVPVTFTQPVTFEDGFTMTGGSATFDGPVSFTQPVAMTDGLAVTGGLTTDNLTVTSNAVINGTLIVDAAANLEGGAFIENGLHVTGGETVDTLHVTGNEQVDGNLNVDGTVTASAFLNPEGQPGSVIPAYVNTAFTTPPVGSSVPININSSYMTEVGQTVIVADPTVPFSFLGTITAGNGFPATQITVLAEFYYSGSSGDAATTSTKIYPGGGVANVTSSDNTILISRSLNDVNLQYNNSNVPVGTAIYANSQITIPAGGNISIVLPGTASNTFAVNTQWIISNGFGQFFSASISLTMGTMTGFISNTAANDTNTVTGGFVAYYSGEAVGGQTLQFTGSGTTSGSGGNITGGIVVQAIALS